MHQQTYHSSSTLDPIIPRRAVKDNLKALNLKLYAVNNTEIATFGKLCLLDLGLRAFKWPFIIANTAGTIIRVDFLVQFDLLIDLKRE
ncbi:hypothetical protein P5V15_002555 [Pogonomyrmex californicus]